MKKEKEEGRNERRGTGRENLQKNRLKIAIVVRKTKKIP